MEPANTGMMVIFVDSCKSFNSAVPCKKALKLRVFFNKACKKIKCEKEGIKIIDGKYFYSSLVVF